MRRGIRRFFERKWVSARIAGVLLKTREQKTGLLLKGGIKG
jgi:hypothetical protein